MVAGRVIALELYRLAQLGGRLLERRDQVEILLEESHGRHEDVHDAITCFHAQRRPRETRSRLSLGRRTRKLVASTRSHHARRWLAELLARWQLMARRHWIALKERVLVAWCNPGQ